MGPVELDPSRKPMSVPLRATAVLGLFLAVGILVFVAFLAPDNGVDGSSLHKGIGLAAVVAAAPATILIRPVDPSTGVVLGGALALAGSVTMFGGNFVGLLMTGMGLAILFAGASRQPPVTVGLVVKLIGYAILLGVAEWLSLGGSSWWWSLVSVLLAAVVVMSPVRDSRT